ncbi:Phosphomannomutase/phosphoglucomutase [Fundidesulfovibrio magnetotacticus]|uniref:Phosphomannomutase/phosphoglucomutase n=1 Tax=Fundidesulfovibrio magnetotacticus TaxID=2730080 RepID=A0A6V8LXX3_9BACT|nr:phosphomannomutase/phosphoglucomutase [Fundidesulfovibrio magnetotacticus]GFK95680.1 Phosphomannomutase/phosphoglucomutase [Fundidesulfovibrio magnetotacticus]
MKPIVPDIFRAYDIRGIVDKDFDPAWVEVFGRACAAYFLEKGYRRAVVGHDARLSSPVYQERLAKGMTDSGLDVTLLGMVSTPVCYFACKHLGTDAGVMITASHNPPQFNGFKVIAGPATIHGVEIQALYRTMAAGKFPEGKGVATRHDIAPAYVEALSKGTRFTRPLKVVVDGGNGAGGPVTVDVLRAAGARVIPLFCEPDGNFPNHHPDPVVEANMETLKARVLAEGADCGIGLDGDGDRLGVVDETGRLLYGDQLLAIYAREVLKDLPGATVIGEVKCSHLAYRDIAAHGGDAVMGATGHSLIKARMLETGAKLAGEMSGHMFFADRYYGYDDATYAALRFLEVLDRNPDAKASGLLADWPRTCNTPEIRFDCPDAIKFKVVERAQAHFRALYDMIDVDGARIVFPDGWGLVRASNTQPVLVLRFEAESEERLAEIRALVETPLSAWIAEMS